MTRLRQSLARRLPSATDERTVIAAFALLLLATGFRVWMVAGSWFYSDDFIFLGDVASGDDTGGWLLEPHNVHFMPFSRWLTILVGHAGTYAWPAAAAQIVILQLLAGIACWWMLRTLFGDRPGILVPLAVYLLSPATTPTVVWWAAAINQLPHQIALFGAVAAHVRYLRNPGWSPALITGAFLVLGYASYTKSVLIPVLLAVLTAMYFAWGRRIVPRLREAIGDYWHAWVVIGTTTVIYLWVYLTVAPDSPAPTPSVVGQTIDLSVVKSAVPALFGGPWNWVTLGQPGGVGPRLFVGTPIVLVMLSWSVLTAMIIWQSLHFRRAWWPALLVLGYAVLSAVIIAVGRATAFGPESAALELRYFADLAGIAALGLGLATMPIIGARSLERRNPPHVRVRLPRRWVIRAGTLAVISALFSSVTYVLPWHDDATMPQRAYISQVRAESNASPLELADASVPDAILWNAAFPASLASRVLAPLGDRVQFVEAGLDLKILDATGRPAPALLPGEPRSAPGPAAGCGYAVQNEPVRIPIAPVIDFPFWMTIGYLSGGDGSVIVTAGSNTRTIDIKEGLHTIYLRTEGAYDAVTVEGTGFTRLCVDSINVGQLTPGFQK